MAKLTIIGNDKPVIGTEEMYSVSSINDWLHPNNNNPFIPPMKPPVTKWGIMVLTKNGWVRTPKNDKEKLIAPYRFTQKSLMNKSIKIIVERGSDTGELIVYPQRAKEPKITKVELLDANYKPIPKGKKLSYKDTIIARAHCVEMFKMNVSFTLWEDDAKGEGHDPIINAFNKINVIPIVKAVNEKGIAEAIFRLPAYTMAVQIANARIAAGDKNEGKTHEYYVTADVVDKKLQKASPNVNVDNPTYNPAPPKRERPKTQTPPPAKPKQPTPPANKPKPKPDSGKFPVTSTGKSNSDPQGKILSAEFVDGNGNRLHSSKVGQTVRIKITGKDLKGKKVKVKVWEEDNFTWTNDEIFIGDFVMSMEDNNYINYVRLTKKLFDKGNDGGGDSSRQDYFIEIIHNDTSIKSSAMEITLDAEPTKVPSGNSATEIAPSKQEKSKEGKCPNCETDITLGQIKAICVSKKNKKGIETCLVEDDKFIKESLPYLNEYRKKVGINTCISKAHFLAQISQESKFFELQERFKYSNPERMRKLFYSYFKQFGNLSNQTKEAERLSKISFNRDQWPEVANAIYGKTHPLGKKHTLADDGWRYSGKGFKQITWKENYENLETYTKSKFGLNVNWVNKENPFKLKLQSLDAMVSALAYWGYKKIDDLAKENSEDCVKLVTSKINPKLEGLDERIRFYNKAVEILQVNKCKPQKKTSQSNEKGTVVIVSGTETKIEKDPYKPSEFSWVMYKTSVFQNMSLNTYYDLEKSNKLPEADYTTYLSRDTHQTSTSKGDILQHSDKRFGKYNEIPPGEYFLVPGVTGQKYKIYVIDSESKSAAAENGIDGPDGSRGGVALHHYCPRFSVGCFTFNSGKDKTPVQNLIDNLPDLPTGDKKPVHFIVQPRKVKETTWNNSNFGTKKWIGI